MKLQVLSLAFGLSVTSQLCLAHSNHSSASHSSNNQHRGHILSEATANIDPAFDVLHTKVELQSAKQSDKKSGKHYVFEQQVNGGAGSLKPNIHGQLAGSSVYSYVWPTNLDSASVGFDRDQGILALAVTSHPDFDDTPLVDENGDGDPSNDGDLWHSHWVVLLADEACGPGALKVKDIPKGAEPVLPKTWPGLAILIDSPNHPVALTDDKVRVSVPQKAINTDKKRFNFDGVTAALRVNASVHNPLLCVSQIFDVASKDLSLPGQVVNSKKEARHDH